MPSVDRLTLPFWRALRVGFDVAGYERWTGHRRVTSVSYPRSGHHLLVRLLARYYWRRPAASPKELWTRTPWRGGFHYCLNYDHCGKTPCRHPWTTFQKHHDFGLRLPRADDKPYLVQYRHPIDSITSRYHVETLWLRSFEDTEANWKTKSWEWVQYWKGFVRKWVLGPPSPNVLTLSYDELVARPLDSLRGAVRFLSPSKPLDEALLEASVEAERPSGQRSGTRFPHHDEGYFREMERELLPELRALNLEPRFLT